MKVSDFTVVSNEKIADGVYQMILSGDTGQITRPAPFINIRLDGFYLRRPISVCDWDDRSVTIIYKVVGGGTEKMSHFSGGEALDVMTGLGNGFDISAAGERPLLIGGGVGTPPLYRLAKELKNPIVILGFNSKSDVFYEDEFKALPGEVYITTADGSYGIRGFVTDAMKDIDGYSYTYSCGPEPMLRAVYNASKTDGEYSFEERMGCGFGACMGCSCKTKYGYKRICKDGPVLKKDEIIF